MQMLLMTVFTLHSITSEDSTVNTHTSLEESVPARNSNTCQPQSLHKYHLQPAWFGTSTRLLTEPPNLISARARPPIPTSAQTHTARTPRRRPIPAMTRPNRHDQHRVVNLLVLLPTLSAQIRALHGRTPTQATHRRRGIKSRRRQIQVGIHSGSGSHGRADRRGARHLDGAVEYVVIPLNA